MPDDTLLDFAYGELSEDLVSTVSAHVASCPQCGAAVASIRGVRTTMAKLPVEQAPDAGLDSLLSYADLAARRNAEPAKRATPWWAKLLPVAVSVSALVVVGGIGLQVARSMPDPLTSVPQKPRSEAPAPAPSRAAESASADRLVELYGSAEASGSGSPVNLAAMKGESKQKVTVRSDGAQVVKKDQSGQAADAIAASPQVAVVPAAPKALVDAKDERLQAKESDDAFGRAVVARESEDFESAFGIGDGSPAKRAMRNDAPRPLAKLESAAAGARPPPAASPVAEARTTAPSTEAKKSVVAQVPELLETARRAKRVRDWDSVVAAAMRALPSARGQDREATLQLLCDATTALAQAENAAKYCGLLAKEFPKDAAP